MKIQKVIFSGICLFLVAFLFYVNIGLNISGPANQNKIAVEQVHEKINRRFPQLKEINRHSFKYITYSAVLKDKAYFFDYEGVLIVEKPYDESQIKRVKELAASKGFEDVEVTLGYGYTNPVFVVEKDNQFLYVDYDTLEIVFYMKG